MIKSSKTLFIGVFILTSLFFYSCSENTTDDPEPQQEEICTKTCSANLVLNEEDCSCEEKPCEKVCETGYTLNADSCECEKDPEPFTPKIIKMETETAVLVNANWKLKTEISNYKGTGYIVWEGNSRFGTPKANEALTYKINVEKAGTYAFKWRSYIAKIDPDEGAGGHNDSWIGFPDADDFFAVRDKEDEAFSRKTPNATKLYYFKAYMNTLNKWNNWCGTVDFKPHGIYATFDTSGEYTVSIAPRSNYHAIDQFTLTEVAPDVRLK